MNALTHNVLVTEVIVPVIEVVDPRSFVLDAFPPTSILNPSNLSSTKVGPFSGGRRKK